MDDRPWHETVSMPALLRHARNAYANAMRGALAEAGYDDIPKNGLYVIGGLAKSAGEVPLGQLIKELGVSKQAGGQLVDTLVLRGYLERQTDPDDRRKLTVALTPRGAAAAAVQSRAIDAIDARLLIHTCTDDILRTRRTLAALIAIGRAGTQSQAPVTAKQDQP